MRLRTDRCVALVRVRRNRSDVFRRRQSFLLVVVFRRELLREPAVSVPQSQFRAVREGSDANTLRVHIRSVGRSEVVEDEEAALEDDFGVMARHFWIAQNNIVSW